MQHKQAGSGVSSPQKPKPAFPLEPHHVMTRKHYERLAREAAGQK